MVFPVRQRYFLSVSDSFLYVKSQVLVLPRGHVGGGVDGFLFFAPCLRYSLLLLQAAANRPNDIVNI